MVDLKKKKTLSSPKLMFLPCQSKFKTQVKTIMIVELSQASLQRQGVCSQSTTSCFSSFSIFRTVSWWILCAYAITCCFTVFWKLVKTSSYNTQVNKLIIIIVNIGYSFVKPLQMFCMIYREFQLLLHVHTKSPVFRVWILGRNLVTVNCSDCLTLGCESLYTRWMPC